MAASVSQWLRSFFSCKRFHLRLRDKEIPDPHAARSLMRPFVRDERGAAAIETALGLMLILTCMLGIIECCLMVYTYSVYTDAAREGARYATLHGLDSTSCSGPSAGCADPTAANVISYVKTYASTYTAQTSSLSVTVSYPDAGGCATPSRVIVTVAYVYKPLFKLPGMAPSFQASSQGRIVY